MEVEGHRGDSIEPTVELDHRVGLEVAPRLGHRECGPGLSSRPESRLEARSPRASRRPIRFRQVESHGARRPADLVGEALVARSDAHDVDAKSSNELDRELEDEELGLVSHTRPMRKSHDGAVCRQDSFALRVCETKPGSSADRDDVSSDSDSVLGLRLRTRTPIPNRTSESDSDSASDSESESESESDYTPGLSFLLRNIA